MSTITSLSQTSSEEVRQLLEMHGIIIKKTIGNRFDIICPSCEKPEAYIYFNEGTRIIKCNRGNNCGKELELWHYIADKQGIDPSNNFEILKYINEVLGHEFKQEQIESYNAEREERNKEQKFLTDCNQIFFNALNNNKDDDRVSCALIYLQQRGYTEEHTKQCGLGFFPDRDDLLNHLKQSPYFYSINEAVELMTKYFDGVLNHNDYQKQEEAKNRITFAWYDHKNNISGFSIRKASIKDLDHKYINSNELKRGEILFNLNNLKEKRELVIVEGMLDALTPNYFATEEVKQKYHFIATGQNNITEKQVQLLKNKGYSQVILLLDRDKGGENFLKSTSKLRKAAITPFIDSIPQEYQVKDIDELIRKHPEVDLLTILDSAKYAVEAEVEQIIKNHNEAKNNVDRDKAIRACLELRLSLLMSEHEPYRKVMYEKLGVRVEEQEEVTKLEQTTSTINSGNINSEIEKLKSEIQLKIQEIEEGKHSNIDIHEFKKRVHVIQKLVLKNDITADKIKSDLKALDNILINVEKYNDLLCTNYDDDEAYSTGKILDLINNNPEGMLTGFKALDENIRIQPSSLVFVAGKPSHGKTTMMLNLLRNMIKAYPNKAFLFYSYEESIDQIWLKLISGEVILSEQLSLPLDKRSMFLRKMTEEIKKVLTLECNSNVHDAYKKVNKWIEEERLQLLDRKPNIETLSSAIIERSQKAKKAGKPVAAIFIDYVQKLNTREQKINRQQEIQRICQTLLNTAMDKRVNAAIILGAQVNRSVESLSTLNMGSMREAADIEQDANLILGVWDERAAKLDRLQQRLEEVITRLENATTEENREAIKKHNELKIKIEKEIETESKSSSTKKVIKVLKNRNGLKDICFDLSNFPARFLMENENKEKEYLYN
jgi:DNA primase